MPTIYDSNDKRLYAAKEGMHLIKVNNHKRVIVSTGHIVVVNHSSDGSETIVEYDTNGEKREDGSPAIDHISFLSSDDVNRRNSRVAGSSFDTRNYGDVGGGFMGPASSGSGKFIDGAGQVLNAGGVVYGGAEMGIQGMRSGNAAQVIGKATGFGTQQTAQALRGTLGAVSKVGKGLGVAGYGLQAGTTLYKAANNMPISTAEQVGLGVSTVLIGAAYFAAGTAAAPFVAAGALIYGAAQLGSYIFTGQTVEEHIFGK